MDWSEKKQRERQVKDKITIYILIGLWLASLILLTVQIVFNWDYLFGA